MRNCASDYKLYRCFQLAMSVGTILVLPRQCHVIRHVMGLYHGRSLRRKYDLVRCSNFGLGVEPSPIAAVVIFA